MNNQPNDQPRLTIAQFPRNQRGRWGAGIRCDTWVRHDATCSYKATFQVTQNGVTWNLCKLHTGRLEEGFDLVIGYRGRKTPVVLKGLARRFA